MNEVSLALTTQAFDKKVSTTTITNGTARGFVIRFVSPVNTASRELHIPGYMG